MPSLQDFLRFSFCILRFAFCIAFYSANRRTRLGLLIHLFRHMHMTPKMLAAIRQAPVAFAAVAKVHLRMSFTGDATCGAMVTNLG